MRKLVIFLSLALLLFAGTAFADDGAGVPEGISNYQLAVPRALAAKTANEYWTKERMEEALANPKDVWLPGPGALSKVTPLVENAQPLAGQGGQDCRDCSTATQGAMSNGIGALSCPASGYMTQANTCGSVFPMRVVGKIFFTDGVYNYVCSGSLVNGRMILTAGHCVSDGAGNWYSNIIFVPAYLNGAEPYGRGTVTDGSVRTAWHTSKYYPNDYAFMILDTWLGSSLGWLSVAYNMLYTTQVYSQYGYPAASPYDGSTLYVNMALVGVTDSAVGTPATIGIGSSFTGGSSGGPWIIGNYANGVTSYGYSNCAYTIYSPYFDATTQSLYDTVYARQ